MITIATPFRGSEFSNQTTQWLADKIIQVPKLLMQSQEALYRDNKDLLDGHSLLKIETSVNAWLPACPIFAVMLASPRPPWVKYHNILGENPHRTMLGKLTTNSDGVIAYDSAHVNDTVSELIVPSDHGTVHCHPLAILEVRRILLEHLAGLRGNRGPTGPSPRPRCAGRDPYRSE